MRVRGRCLRRCRVCFFHKEEREREGEGSVFLAVTPLGFGARVNCRRFLAGHFFWSGDVCRWGFVFRVSCASIGLGSNLMCSIGERVA